METKPTILVADDSDDDILFVLRAMRRLGFGEGVRTVTDREQAIAYLQGTAPFENREQHPLPKLMLLDLKMPKVNGFEVLQWLQTQVELNSLAVVVFSSSNLEADIAKAKLLGAREFHTKPNDSEELVMLLRNLTTRWLSPIARRDKALLAQIV